MYKAEDVGQFIIGFCKKRNYDIPHPKLQKLLYFVQGYFVAHGEPCFNEEIEVSKSGPVVSEVALLYNRYGGYDLLIFENNIKLQNLEESPISEKDRTSIGKIVDWLAEYSSSELFEIIKKQPIWQKAVENTTSQKIELSQMKEFYQ